MTTIAYKDGVIAYDSRCSAGPEIIDDDFDKHIKREDIDYFISGSTSEIEDYIKAHTGKDVKKGVAGSWFSVESGSVFRCGVNDEDGFFKMEIDKSKHYVIGSGGDHAITAMDLGLPAKDAVKMAVKRDAGTGGRIRTFKVKSK